MQLHILEIKYQIPTCLFNYGKRHKEINFADVANNFYVVF